MAKAPARDMTAKTTRFTAIGEGLRAFAAEAQVAAPRDTAMREVLQG